MTRRERLIWHEVHKIIFTLAGVLALLTPCLVLFADAPMSLLAWSVAAVAVCVLAWVRGFRHYLALLDGRSPHEER